MKYSVETLPRMDADIKKKAGLYTNNTFKGDNNFEKAPTLNGVPIGSNDLNGTNYLMVYGTGTPTENAAELQAAYNEAKNMPRYIGEFENNISTFTGILAVGSTFACYDTNEPLLKYYFKVTVATSIVSGSEIPTSDLEWYTVIPTEAEAKSVRTTVIVAPGVYGFNSSFSIDATSINVVSFTGNRDIIITHDVYLSKEYVHLKGIDTLTNRLQVISGLSNYIIENCISGDDGFSAGNTLAGTYINCDGGLNSFAGDGGSLEGILISCRLKSGTFPTTTGAGKIYNCIDGNGDLINSVTITIPDGDAANEAVNKGQFDTLQSALQLKITINTDNRTYPSGDTLDVQHGLYQFTSNTTFDLNGGLYVGVGSIIILKTIGNNTILIEGNGGACTLDGQDIDVSTAGSAYSLSGSYVKMTLLQVSAGVWITI